MSADCIMVSKETERVEADEKVQVWVYLSFESELLLN